MRSSKFANLKYVFGIVTVFALLAAFACEKEESVDIVLAKENSEMSLSFFGDKLRIDANTADLNKLKELFSGKANINLESDSLGNLFFVKSKNAPKVLDKGEKIYQLADKMPEFPGGVKGLMTYIAKNVKYPNIARENNITGKVYVRFVVRSNGQVDDVSITRGVDPAIDKEAMRVVKTLPRWKPGKQRGKAVNVWYSVPINFRLQ